MVRGTNTTFLLTFDDDFDLTNIEGVVVSIRQGSVAYDFTDDAVTITDEGITVTLTQEQSLSFEGCKTALIQVNGLYADSGFRWASRPQSFVVAKNLYNEVIS